MHYMNIACVRAMGKIGRDTTEPHETQNMLPMTPNPNRRRNINNENAQNTVTRAKLSQQNKQAKYVHSRVTAKTVVDLRYALTDDKRVTAKTAVDLRYTLTDDKRASAKIVVGLRYALTDE